MSTHTQFVVPLLVPNKLGTAVAALHPCWNGSTHLHRSRWETWNWSYRGLFKATSYPLHKGVSVGALFIPFLQGFLEYLFSHLCFGTLPISPPTGKPLSWRPKSNTTAPPFVQSGIGGSYTWWDSAKYCVTHQNSNSYQDCRNAQCWACTQVACRMVA